MAHPLFATKSVDKLRADAEFAYGLKRTLTALDLVLLGIGAIIGTGIFTYRPGCRRQRRPCRRPLLHCSGHRVRLRGAVLFGDGVHDPNRGQRLHLFLRHHG